MWILLRMVLLSAAFALATVALGWIAVPIVGLLWGLIARATRRPALTAAVAALTAWAGLLVWTACVGRVPALLDRMGRIFHIRGAFIVIATLVLAGVLAMLGASMGNEVRRRTP